jgi:oligopeptide transport system substrate-binding protein
VYGRDLNKRRAEVRSKTWFLLLAALVSVLALGLAGCGGDDDDGEAGDTGGGEPAAEQLLRINIGSEPPSLDPTLATDNISSFVLQQIMDPLVSLDEAGEVVNELAESWDEEGNVVTFHLSEDGKWTNGDPVTANDFVYAWKRILDPEVAAEYAYQLTGIQGAAEYNSCESDCDALADAVGVRAVDDFTLEVTLTSPQPWFISQTSHQSFLPVHQATVEEFGDTWTDPENIVTSGPFQLTDWQHDSSLTLEKWDEWRDAGNVTLTRVEARMISDPVTALQAFENGEVDACLDNSCEPPQEIDRLKETEEWTVVPNLATYYYGFNLANIPDVNQRKAMALAIDRTSVVENVTKAGEIPATNMTPEGVPGFDVLKQDYLPATADLEQAQQLLDQAQSPKTKMNLFYNNAPGHKEIAVAIQAMWKELGLEVTLKQQEWAQFLEFIGPPPDKAVDVFRLGWLGDYVEAFNFLELWTCESGNNSTGFCDEAYDAAINEARATPDDDARYELYRQAEEILFAEDGAFPIIPIYWYTTSTMRASKVEGWTPNIIAQYDLTKVSITE